MLTILLQLQLFAQPATALHFERVEGLSQNTGYSITKDVQGFLWIATANGLNRYDGIEMKSYKPGLERKPGQMQGRVIRSELLEDAQGQIWFSTDLTVHCFNKRNGTYTTYNLLQQSGIKNNNKQPSAAGLFANPFYFEGTHLWLASANAGLFDLDTTTKKVSHHPLTQKDEAGNDIQLMYNGAFDGKGRFWFASSKGLMCFDKTKLQWQRYFPGRSFYSVAFSKDTLFASEGKEINWVDVKNLQSGRIAFADNERKMDRDFIHKVYSDKQSNTWAGDEKGNVYCKRPNNSFFKWMGNINLSDDNHTNYPVYSFYSDTSGILWAGAYALGLLKAEINEEGFKNYPQSWGNAAGENIFVNTIYENKIDELWLGTFQNGIKVLDKKTGKITDLKLPYSDPSQIYGNSVPLIQSDSKGNVWTSMSGYLFVRENGKKDFVSIRMPVPSNALQVPQLWSLSEYRNGWLAGTTVGLYHISKQQDHYLIRHLSQFGQTRVLNTWSPDDKEVWIAFEAGGLSIARNIEDASIVERKFTETNVRSFLYNKERQLLWISTSSGLIAYHLPSGKYKSFTEREGLLNSYVYGAVQGDNELWISTNYGLSRAIVFFTNNSRLPDLQIHNFTTSDGLADNVFNARAFYKGNNGDFYFGTPKGLTWFKSTDIKPKQDLPQLRLINLLVNEMEADTTLAPEYINSLSLPYYKNNLFFRFRGIDYKDAQKVNYAYQLRGWDKDWIYSKQLNEVRYSKLPPGNYLFKVKAANGSGKWNDNVYTVSVYIHPPFWKTTWFYILSGLFLLLTVIGITRYFSQQKLKMKVTELEKQKEIYRERQRISREMHDDIGAGLTQITLISESAKQQAGQGFKELDEIAGTSRKLVGNMGEIIWSLNPENETMGQLMAYMREQLSKLLEYSQIYYTIDLPDDQQELPLSSQQRRNILMVTKEIVHNAIKYSQASTITVKAWFAETDLLFEVTDNGTGFDIENVHKGNGLKNIKQRVLELQGYMDGFSEIGKGSRFVYSFPLRSTT